MSLFRLNWGVIFVHIPKTGGTSIRHDCQVGRGYQTDPPKAWRGMPSFCFVRTPVERVASAWRDFRYLRQLTDLDFEDFVRRYVLDQDEAAVLDPRTIEHHVAPMTHPVHGIRHAEFIGSFDRLHQDYTEFRRQMGLDAVPLDAYRASRKFQPGGSIGKAARLIERAHAVDYAVVDLVKNGPYSRREVIK